MATSKQDRQGARTVSDLELRYRFDKSFAEVEGIATDAQKEAREAKKIVEGLDQEKIFELLTEDGKWQGIFRADDGSVYLNGTYIKAGTFTSERDVFLNPGYEEMTTILNHVSGVATIPAGDLYKYDFDGDKSITENDAHMVEGIARGDKNLDNWQYRQTSKVRITIDVNQPTQILNITGTNMWGRSIDRAIGIDSAFLSSAENGGMYRRLSDGKKEWLNPARTPDVIYRTLERFNGKAVQSIVLEFPEVPSDGMMEYSTGIANARTIISINALFYDESGFVWHNPNYMNIYCAPGGTGQYNLVLSADSLFYGWTGFAELKYI